VTLFEAADRLGGILQTQRRDGFLVEESADGFITDPPWGVDFCRRLGFESELIETDAVHRRAMIVRNGRLVPVPEGFVLMEPGAVRPLMTSPLLSWRGKLRLLGEPWIGRRHGDADESVASLIRRRFGREAFERVLQPLLAGMYTADPEKLSAHATLPKLVAQEREYGSLVRASRNKHRQGAMVDSGARYSLFVAPREGMGSMVSAIASRLSPGWIELNAKVSKLETTSDGRWSVFVGEDQNPLAECDAVIVALAAHHAAEVLKPVDERLAASLREIEYAGVAVVSLGFRRSEIDHPLDCFGFVVPTVERCRILSGSFSSVKYPGRAPSDMVLIRVFVGGALAPERVELPDAELSKLVLDELRSLIGLRGEPVFQEIARWPRAMPQYHVGHLDRVGQIEAEVKRWPGLELAGNAYRGVGIPHCVRSGELAAQRAIEGLRVVGPGAI
jgi:oxygen-dependent protoporphyrinogen oxidase